MKNNYLLLGLCCLLTFNLQAQFEDDMESYTVGERIYEAPWYDWSCSGDCAIWASSAQAHEGSQSGYIGGDPTTDLVDGILDLGSKYFGEWGIEFWVYIPSGKQAYLVFLESPQPSTGIPYFAHTYFNKDNNSPGIGSLEDTALGTIAFNYPQDEWFKIVINWDLTSGMSTATWQYYIDGIEVIPEGTPFTNEWGGQPDKLGAIEFYSGSANNELYVDDFKYVNGFIDPEPNPIPFTDDMESYTDGDPINEAHWTNGDCDSGEGCSLMSTSVRAHNGSLSGLVPGDGTSEPVLDIGNVIFGEWTLQFWVYIPESKEAAMSLQGIVPYEEGNNIVGDIYFNKDLASPGIGVVSDSALGEISFNFPHNEWFRVVMNWDISSGISTATWRINIDNVDVLPYGTLFTNELGEPAQSLGGLKFFSNSINNEMYIDNFEYLDENIVFNTESFNNSDFKIYPNPTENFINIQSNETIKSVTIYNVLGKNILTTSKTNNIDIYSLAKGMYFVMVETENGKGTQKLIKD